MAGRRQGQVACSCIMYERRGICYHTGYKPSFRESLQEKVYKQVLKQIKEEREKNP